MKLPIDDVLTDLITALSSHRKAVLQAPPGAGKTTRVPLALLDAALSHGTIIMLEPRRLAARAAAERMAQTLGEDVGQTVGYRIRGEAKVGPNCKIEVVTEGILTRRLQSDPELSGVGAVIFDEFHERSLNADLGLALCLEVREALRDDLILIVMSATLDAAPVAALMDNAPIITSQGRSFPVETKWLDHPLPKTQRYEVAVADLTASAAQETKGGILVFLPGEGEIRRVENALKGKLPNDCIIHPLYGAMKFAAQRAAIQPAKHGRKVVLATSIAETSLTIQDIRVVVDGGKARRARFDPNSGMSRLITEKVTKAEAEQRRGRAGRVADGHCFRLWTKGEEGALSPFPPAEIEAADLTGLVLELAQWGANTAADLKFLTPPPTGSFREAQQLLETFGALKAERITDHGRVLAGLPLHPRLGHMLTIAGPAAADLAALLADRDPLETRDVDISLRLKALNGSRDQRANPAALKRIKDEAKRLRNLTRPNNATYGPAEMTALAYPDRIGLRRKGDNPRWVLSGGKGAITDDGDPLAGTRLLVATDLDGNQREARIRSAIEISESELRTLYGDQIGWTNICEWSKRDRRVVARQHERFGHLILNDRLWRDATPEAIARAALDGVRLLGLPKSKAAIRLIKRVELTRAGGADLPDMSDASLLASLEDWLLPHFINVKTADDIRNFDILEPLRAMLDWGQTQRLDQLTPPHFTTPLGNKTPIDYDGEAPSIELRLQELFGVTQHPTVGQDRVPLRITLLSPARRPVQVTMDLPGFWSSSYEDVRKDMRGRYPRHPWPDDPTQADPTLRVKRKPT
ncbi:ATP-dependent helicase HrpB [Cochlodiniinecator piscidefendens]|uniref:ATP-dependent helicase HrpB n=1 Tax=Cochlodiniinecator piscidefendens TaxID=2715756 RepID=UPI00140E84E2|nr:ATP-dependent helicase HrpB [Cochlodiniinecator piscidefendens]